MSERFVSKNGRAPFASGSATASHSSDKFFYISILIESRRRTGLRFPFILRPWRARTACIHFAILIQQSMLMSVGKMAILKKLRRLSSYCRHADPAETRHFSKAEIRVMDFLKQWKAGEA